jgi:hypothetical protein
VWGPGAAPGYSSDLQGATGSGRPLSKESLVARLQTSRRYAAVGLTAAVLAAANVAATTVRHLEAGSAIVAAVRADQRLPGVRLRFSLGTTAQHLRWMTKDKLPVRTAALYAGAAVTYTLHTADGEPLDTPGLAKSHLVDSAVAYSESGQSLLQLVGVGDRLYGRVRLQGLLWDWRAPAGTLARVRRSLLRENKTVPGITALGRGEWVSVDPAQLESPTTLQSQGDRVVTAMREALESATRFQLIRASAGRGEYEATVVARAFLTRLSAALKGVTNPAGGPPFGAVIHGMVRGVPAGTTVVVHLLVLDGRLSEVQVDLGQWSRAPRPTLPLVLRISPAGPVTAPAHSVAIDVTPLAKQLKGGPLAPRWVRGLVAGPAPH